MNKRKSLQEIHEDVPAEHYDRGIENNVFQRIWHLRRFSEVMKIVEPIDGSFLDLGCHSGTFTGKILSKIKSRKIYGLDISASAINFASRRIPQGHFIVADAHDLPYKNNFFDMVFCLEMLEHVDDPKKVLMEIKRVLKKDKKAIILVPSESKLFKVVWFLWTLYYPIWKHAHVQNFQNSELEALMRKVGFKIVKIKTFNLGMLKLVVCQK